MQGLCSEDAVEPCLACAEYRALPLMLKGAGWRTTLLSVSTMNAVSRSMLKPSIPLKMASAVNCPLQGQPRCCKYTLA